MFMTIASVVITNRHIKIKCNHNELELDLDLDLDDKLSRIVMTRHKQ